MADFINTIDRLGDDAVIDSIIDRSITEFKDDTVTVVGYAAFNECTELTAVDLPEVTTIHDRAFAGCTNLSELHFPKLSTYSGNLNGFHGVFRKCKITEVADEHFPMLTNLSGGIFRDCTSLTKVSLTNVTEMSWYALGGCSGITELNLPNLRTIGMNGCPPITTNLRKWVFPSLKTIANYGLSDTRYLEEFDCASTTAEVLTIGGTGNFGGSNIPLKAWIIRSASVAQLGGSILGNTLIGKGTGYIYVPRALVDSYKVATNWSTYASQFRALEDYTVDGTITGELDETKI